MRSGAKAERRRAMAEEVERARGCGWYSGMNLWGYGRELADRVEMGESLSHGKNEGDPARDSVEERR